MCVLKGVGVYIGVELTEMEIENLSRGGFITLLGDRGIRVTVTKDVSDNDKESINFRTHSMDILELPTRKCDMKSA